jgi:iron complex outermembrane recepter protein
MSLARSLTLLIVLLPVTPVWAQTKSFDVPAQTAVTGIPEFARQASVQILVAETLIRGKRTNAVRGSYSIDDALTKLLEGMGLRYEVMKDRTIVVHQIAAVARSDEGIQLALVENSDAAAPEDDAESASSTKPTELTEILVTGTYIRGADPFSPVIRATRDEIIAQGYSRLDQFVDALPQNSAGGGSSMRSNPIPTGGGGTGSINYAFASGVNLRGLGPNATLVLLNGQRLPQTAYGNSVDISKIPLSAIERVEILTDGASATYGADAVAGVMNIITRRDFSGVESGIRLDAMSSGKDPSYGAYVLAGHDWDSGNTLLTVDHQQDEPLFTEDRSFSRALERSMLLPEISNTSVYGAVHMRLTPDLALNADTSASSRDFSATYTLFGSPDRNSGQSKQYSARAGFDYGLSGSWTTSIAVNFGDENDRLDGTFGLADTFIDYRTFAAQWKADGALFDLPAGAVRSALGVEYRDERYEERRDPRPSFPGSRESYAAYAELLIPIIGRESGMRLAHELSFHLAARYDHYDDFGESTNPKVAVRWMPVADLALQASYGTSFRAPALSLLSANAARFGYVFDFPDPSSSVGTRRSLFLDNTGNPNLTAEESESFSAGLQYRPAVLAGFQLEMSYFDIDFDGRIIRPSDLGFLNVFIEAARYGDLILFDPTVEQIDAALATPGLEISDFTPTGYSAEQIRAIANMGYVNAAVDHARGLDFSSVYRWDTSIGELRIMAGATRFLGYDTQVDASGTASSDIDRVGRPPKLRGNMLAGWHSRGWSGYLRANHIASYVNQYDAGCDSATCRVDSSNTLDIGISYETLRRAAGRGSMIALDVMDILDSSPRRVRGFPVGYDVANASPLGRAFSAKLVKRW